MTNGDDLQIAIGAAAAGASELSARYRSCGVRETAQAKSVRRDLVTDADKASEAAILAVLRRERPDDVIIAEESAAHVAPGRRTWIVDPLDGTVNYAHGIPFFAVSIGLVVDGRPQVGVVHAPASGEVHAGDVASGATLHGAAIRPSATAELADSLLSSGFAYDVENLADDNFENFLTLSKAARALRRLGSAALELCWVACGRLDGFWELHLNAWDVAAGAAILRAAGGTVTDLTGGEEWLFGRHIAATNGRIHGELLRRLRVPSYARR